MLHEVEFTAALAPIAAAILISGNGTGSRMKLDVAPEDIEVLPKIQREFTEHSFMVRMELEQPVLIGKDGEDVSWIAFMGSLPEVQTAMSASGVHGGGVRVMVDLPETESDVIPLIQVYFAGTVFRTKFSFED